MEQLLGGEEVETQPTHGDGLGVDGDCSEDEKTDSDDVKSNSDDLGLHWGSEDEGICDDPDAADGPLKRRRRAGASDEVGRCRL